MKIKTTSTSEMHLLIIIFHMLGKLFLEKSNFANEKQINVYRETFYCSTERNLNNALFYGVTMQ